MTSLPYIIEAIQTHTLDPTLKFYPELYPVSFLPTPYSRTLPSLPLLLLQAHITPPLSFFLLPHLTQDHNSQASFIHLPGHAFGTPSSKECWLRRNSGGSFTWGAPVDLGRIPTSALGCPSCTDWNLFHGGGVELPGLVGSHHALP